MSRSPTTRDELLALGQSGQAREFLAIAVPLLRAGQRDPMASFLAAANFGRLGLADLAREFLSELPAEMQAHADAKAMANALGTLPSAQECHPEEGNANRRAAGITVPDGECRVWQATDGGWVVRTQGQVYGLGLDPTHARNLVRQMFQGQLPCPGPVAIGGAQSAALIHAAWTESRAFIAGYSPRIHVIDARASAHALSCGSMAEVAHDPRVHWWVGPGAAERFAAWCRERPDLALPACVLPSEGRMLTEHIELQRVLDQLRGHQQAELGRQLEGIAEWIGEREREGAASRYAGERLRVLVLSCRHTTVVRHAAADLAGALASLGHEVRVLEEPDEHSKLTLVSYARAMNDLRPDLVVGINFAREPFGAAIPPSIPYVCWIQDAMDQLFDARRGAKIGEFDFVMGHTYPELFTTFKYPAERLIPAAMVASDTKFTPSPVRDPNRFAAEIAMISHHSETPRALHDRLAQKQGKGGQDVLEALYPKVQDAVRECSRFPVTLGLKRAIAATFVSVAGREGNDTEVNRLLRQYAQPVADRMLRHETLAWAQSICDRRGWRLAIYGNGWDEHPTLGRHARGAVEHGEEARAAYQCAALNLHASITTAMHQRIMECFLSGGLCATRMHADFISGPRTTMSRALCQRRHDVEDDARNAFGYLVCDHAEAMHFVTLLGRLGESHEGPYVWVDRGRAQRLRNPPAWLGDDYDPDALCGDMSLLAFKSESELEQLAEKAVLRPSWREAVGVMARTRIESRFTHRALARRLLSCVREQMVRKQEVATP